MEILTACMKKIKGECWGCKVLNSKIRLSKCISDTHFIIQCIRISVCVCAKCSLPLSVQ